MDMTRPPRETDGPRGRRVGELPMEGASAPSRAPVGEATGTRSGRIRSEALDDGAGAEAAAAAHGHQAVAAAGALELVEGLGHQDGAGAAERVAEGDGAAVGVDLGQVDVELLCPGQHDRGERLVDLDDVDVVHRQAGALEQALGGVDRAGEHEHGVDADEAGVDDPGPRAQAELVGLLGGHEQHARRRRRRSATTSRRCARRPRGRRA